MLRLSAVLVFLLSAQSALAAEKPSALTPKEVAEGWILLFDGETTYGWRIDGTAEAKDGVLTLPKGKKTTITTNTAFAFCEIEMELQGDASVRFFSSDFSLQGSERPQLWTKCRFERDKGFEGYSVIGGLSSEKKKLKDAPKPAPFTIEAAGKTDVRLRAVKLRPMNTQPLFNGKNLDGWKVTQSDPKRTATKFEVTKDGELSAKNGPGDLHSEKQFDDFVLQLECKTLGKALNSGVFFRCIPDQYQNGYEAQIQNAWIGDRTKPLDFGTGAVYRRIAARKVVPDDNEWFTLTLAAQGAHFSTWVNGYQTVDWTDDRKANDNPRQGLRLAKGHLSIQGHDPTTDLLFRNIRIVELPKP